MPFFRVAIAFLFLFNALIGSAQHSVDRRKVITGNGPIRIDTLSIYPSSFKLFCGSRQLKIEDYTIDHASSTLTILYECADSLIAEYQVLPMDLSKVYAVRDTSIIYQSYKGDRDKFLITNNYELNDVFGGNSLNKSGSISRGVTFGNNQDLGINSSLNLELSGEISQNLKILASLSDDNLPIQPDGNTAKLQEFDQVYIQIYNDRLKLVAGDFWLYKPKGYFMSYKKRAQGLSTEYQWFNDTTRNFKTQVSGALSKGKFNRQIIQGIEGNQGPYRLKGAENEPFITILAGTERVYIDGKLLDRGQEYDYVIDYNSSELIFTSRNMITKDSRIVVEFQYSDLNYARSLLQTSNVYTSKKLDAWINVYSEQDSKNQTIQQELTTEQKLLLSSIGDSLDLARANSIDSVGYFENQIMYRMIDSLGFDSVLVFSVDPAIAYYRAVFTYVGPNKGDYILDQYSALGKVYKWVSPVAGVPQGDYEPSRLIVAPKQKQMVSGGIAYRFNSFLRIENEIAVSKNDLNTFSNLDRADDLGFSNKFRLVSSKPLGRESLQKWNLETSLEAEFLSADFSPIEQYRSVEFDRDWNTRNKGFKGDQLNSQLSSTLKHDDRGTISLQGQQFLIRKDYSGYRGATEGNWKNHGFHAIWDGSYLNSTSFGTNDFVRHRADISKDFKYVKIGFKDDHELNQFRDTAGSFSGTSYQFFDYQFYLQNGDSIKNGFKIFYRERTDDLPNGNSLVRTAKGTTTGGEIRLTELRNQNLTLLGSYRQLKILDTSLMNLAPENTLLGRIEHDFKIWKGALSMNTFYEAGSGLEQKREFLYIQVNDGQGIYTWIDYNADGIKDLNEFEIAQFVDQASYIRVFTPSSEYTKTYSNELNYSVYWRPERIWANKKGLIKFLSRFSDQARFRIQRKTSQFEEGESFNPFSSNVRDTSLISTSSNIRNSLFFNRTSSIFNAEYNYQDSKSKTLLASGFDSRATQSHELFLRWNIKRKFAIETRGQTGSKLSNADYTSGRNFEIDFNSLQNSFIYQPNTVFRVSLDTKYTEKRNAQDLGNESAYLTEVGTTCKYNQSEKGSFQGGLKFVQIKFNGLYNSAVGFEMLEALRPGNNLTWNLTYQRSVSRNLQLSIQYLGRSSESSKTIHSGGMELRAFF
jgi:hypothetical protein